jgi:hypothetical protein
MRASQALVNGMLAMACESKRTGDLFGNKDLFARASKIVGGLKARAACSGITATARRCADSLSNIRMGHCSGSRQRIYATPAALVRRDRQHQQRARSHRACAVQLLSLANTKPNLAGR